MNQTEPTTTMIKNPRLVSKDCILHCFIILTFLLSGTVSFAQSKDFGTWYTLSLRYDINKRITADISEELRTQSNASEVDQYFTDIGVSYKLNKYVSFGGYYRYIRKKETKDEFYTRNRFYGELGLTYPFDRFELKYRLRFQRQTNKYADDVEEKAPRLYNRHKFSLDYNIPGLKLTPSISYERFYRLKYISSYFSDSERYGITLDYKFNKHHRASLGFLIDKDLDPNIDYLYVLTVGYLYLFN